MFEDQFLPFYGIHECEIFMQDSAPSHTSMKVEQWILEHDICVPEGPGNSPDLNTIEKCWLLHEDDSEIVTSSVPGLTEISRCGAQI